MKTPETKYADLFHNAKRLELSQPTLLEIGGYPHYENVASNYLAYFLDPGQPHGLDDGLLRALWEAIPVREDYYLSEDVTVFREYTTDKRKRIDLLIVLDQHVIAMEHKVNHTLDNDLKNYRELARQQYPNHAWYGVVLHAKPLSIKEDKLHGFSSLTHEKWGQVIQQKIDQKTLDKPQVFQYTFLCELLTTMKRIANGKTMNQELSEFLTRHTEDIEHVNKIVSQFLTAAEQQMQSIKAELAGETRLTYHKQCTKNSMEAWQGLKIVAFYQVKNRSGVECKIRKTPKQCTVEFWHVNSSSSLADVLRANQFQPTKVDGKECYSYTVAVDPGEIHAMVKKVLDDVR